MTIVSVSARQHSPHLGIRCRGTRQCVVQIDCAPVLCAEPRSGVFAPPRRHPTLVEFGRVAERPQRLFSGLALAGGDEQVAIVVGALGGARV